MKELKHLQLEKGKSTQLITIFFGNIGNFISNFCFSDNNIHRVKQQNDSTR
jgi:hypothetical protein